MWALPARTMSDSDEVSDADTPWRQVVICPKLSLMMTVMKSRIEQVRF